MRPESRQTKMRDNFPGNVLRKDNEESGFRTVPLAGSVLIPSGAFDSLLLVMTGAEQSIAKRFLAALDTQPRAHVSDLVLALARQFKICKVIDNF